MAGLGSFSYLEKDYQDILKAIVENIPKITPEWTDWNQSDIGMTVLQLLTGMVEMLSYTEDQHANQLTIPTCTQRARMINLTKSLAYTMSNVTASSVDLQFSRTPYTTTTAGIVLASSITAQSTQSFTLTDASDYEASDVILLNNGVSSEYVIVNYKIGNSITIFGVTRYAYSIADTVLKIDSGATPGGKNVIIADNLKCTTGGSTPLTFETDAPNQNYILYAGNTYIDQTVALDFNIIDKTITVTNAFDFAIGDSLFLKSSLFSNEDVAYIANISGRVVTLTATLPLWLQIGDTVARLVPGTQGETKSENLEASTGLPIQYRDLTYTPVINTSVILEINEGSGNVVWTPVESFFSSDSNDKHFILQIQANDKGQITFGDGVNGKIPAFNSSITATYVMGGGVSGNIGKETINKLVSSVIDVGGATVSLNLINPVAASGGADKESLEIARKRAPALYSAAYRAVSPDDFKALSAGFSDPTYGTISNAKVVESLVANAVSIYVWASDVNGFATSTSSGLKTALLSFLETRAPEGYLVSAVDGFLLSVNITVTVYVGVGFVQAAVKAAVLSAIDGMFQTDVIEPGEDFYLSNLYETLENISGVDRVDVTVPVRPGVSVGPLHMAIKGTIDPTMVGGN